MRCCNQSISSLWLRLNKIYFNVSIVVSLLILLLWLLVVQIASLKLNFTEYRTQHQPQKHISKYNFRWKDDKVAVCGLLWILCLNPYSSKWNPMHRCGFRNDHRFKSAHLWNGLDTIYIKSSYCVQPWPLFWNVFLSLCIPFSSHPEQCLFIWPWLISIPCSSRLFCNKLWHFTTF